MNSNQTNEQHILKVTAVVSKLLHLILTPFRTNTSFKVFLGRKPMHSTVGPLLNRCTNELK